MTWKHVAQKAIGSLEMVSIRLIEHGQAGTVLGLLATLGVVAVFLLVVLRLPEEDIAHAAVSAARSVWVVASAILAATTTLALWAFRVRSHATQRELERVARLIDLHQDGLTSGRHSSFIVGTEPEDGARQRGARRAKENVT